MRAGSEADCLDRAMLAHRIVSRRKRTKARCLPRRSSRLPLRDTRAATEATPFLRRALARPLRQLAKKGLSLPVVAARQHDAPQFGAPGVLLKPSTSPGFVRACCKSSESAVRLHP